MQELDNITKIRALLNQYDQHKRMINASLSKNTISFHSDAMAGIKKQIKILIEKI